MIIGYLRQVSTGGVNVSLLKPCELNQGQQIIIGRDPTCQAPLDPQLYSGVSRRHALIRPSAHSGSSLWEVVDQNSANGVYVNNKQIQQVQILQTGDRIMLGENGPEFVIEYTQSSPATMAVNPPDPKASTVVSRPAVGTPINPINPNFSLSQNAQKNNDNLTITQLIPILSTGKDLKKKAFLVPASLTVIFVVLMFATINTELFNTVLAFYIGGLAYYFIYQLCGKSKPWWLLVLSMMTTIILLFTPIWELIAIIFRDILPGNIEENQGFFQSLIGHFFGAGMAEELLKSIPIFLALFVSKFFNSPHREKIGVYEPLDGILIGSASALGFTLLETLGQYVPNFQDLYGDLAGLQLLIPRILGSVAGHMAYTGYFGYFIGLSVLKPRQASVILPIGYLSSALLHGLWNATGSIGSIGLIFSTGVGIFSYAFLAAAILKARALSPNRSQNFATQFFNFKK